MGMRTQIPLTAGLAFLTASFLLAVSSACTSTAAETGVEMGFEPEGVNILALAIDPQAPTSLYVGTWGGGVFKSTDGGASWSAANMGLTGWISVNALAIDPLNPATLYAGTGIGVFKSTDGGEMWINTNTGLAAADLGALVINSMAKDVLSAIYE